LNAAESVRSQIKIAGYIVQALRHISQLLTALSTISFCAFLKKQEHVSKKTEKDLYSARENVTVKMIKGD